MIAQTPGVERVNLLAHSRGTSVLLDALRELSIASYAAGIEPLTAFKVNNVVLIAPDIDVEVAAQHFQVYTSNPDMVTRWPHAYAPRFISRADEVRRA